MAKSEKKQGKAEEKKQEKEQKQGQKEKEKQEKEEKKSHKQEPELKIIREIKPEIQEIEQEQEQDEEEDFQEGFFIQESESRAEAPVLRKTDLEQTVEEIEIPEDRRKREKEEEEKQGALKYTPDLGEKYFTGEEKEKEEKKSPLLRIEMAPELERFGHIEKQFRRREKPIHFVDDEKQGWENPEQLIKYEQAEPETHGAELPFSPKETERRIKKYKKRI